MSLVTRRLARLARTGSPATTLRATRRELALRRDEAALARGLESGRPVVVGPFTGEVGYELLYWRPFVLRLLRSLQVDPERVTVVGRGGSGAWYGDVAARSVDAFELVAPEDVRDASARRRYGSPKQLEADALDARILAAVAPEDAVLVHPRFMYWRLRFLWEGLRDPAEATALADYDALPRVPLPLALEERLPPEFVAVKAYFNECVPEGPETRAALTAVVEAVAGVAPVVLLATPVAADTHSDLGAAAGAVSVADALDPAANLAQQGEIVARARALVSTYGGFAYLGAFLDVPTAALTAHVEDNPNHERVLRAVRPAASFARVAPDPVAVLRSLAA